MQENDLTADELDIIGERVTRALDARPAMPLPALQYRLGEVGRARVDPKQLYRALCELANEQRPRGSLEAGPWNPIPGLYVSSRESASKARRLATRTAEIVSGLTTLPYRAAFEVLVQLVSNVLPEGINSSFLAQETLPTVTSSPPSIAQSDSFFPGTPIGAGVAATLWISHDIDPLYPDDPRLWRALDIASSVGEPLLILTRAVVPATFPLLRGLGAQAVQYYSLLLPTPVHSDVAKAAETVGWFHLRHVEELRKHKVIDQLGAAQRRLVDIANAGGHLVGAAAVVKAKEAQLDHVATGSENWLKNIASAVDLPDPWISTIRRWAYWEKADVRVTPFPSSARPMLPALSDTPLRQRRRPPPVAHAVDNHQQLPADFGRLTEVSRIGVRAY